MIKKIDKHIFLCIAIFSIFISLFPSSFQVPTEQEIMNLKIFHYFEAQNTKNFLSTKPNSTISSTLCVPQTKTTQENYTLKMLFPIPFPIFSGNQQESLEKQYKRRN